MYCVGRVDRYVRGNAWGLGFEPHARHRGGETLFFYPRKTFSLGSRQSGLKSHAGTKACFQPRLKSICLLLGPFTMQTIKWVWAQMVYKSKKIHHYFQLKTQISLFLDRKMSHTSNETWEDETANLWKRRMDGGIEWSLSPSMNSSFTSKNRARDEQEQRALNGSGWGRKKARFIAWSFTPYLWLQPGLKDDL
jgi:hypothetical protein